MAVNGAVRLILRQEPHLPVAAGIALDRGLVPQQGHHDLAVVSGLLLAHHHQIVRQNACVEHGLPPNPEGKILAAVAAGVEGQVVLDALLRQNGGTCGHRPHNGDLVLLRQRLRQGQRPALAGPLADDPQLLHVFQVKMDGGGGFQPHGVPNFPHGGGIALRPDGLGDIVIDPLLHLRELYHVRRLLRLHKVFHSIPYILSVCNRCSMDFSEFFRAKREFPLEIPWTIWYDGLYFEE